MGMGQRMRILMGWGMLVGKGILMGLGMLMELGLILGMSAGMGTRKLASMSLWEGVSMEVGMLIGLGHFRPQQGRGCPTAGESGLGAGARSRSWGLLCFLSPVSSSLPTALCSWCSCRRCWSCQASPKQKQQLAGRSWSGTGAWRHFAWPHHTPWHRPAHVWSAACQHCCMAGHCVSGAP